MVSDSADTRDHKVSVRTELIAGVTTFFTMAYIVVVNPSILSTEGTGCLPLTFSITKGILWGFITHAGLSLLAGRARESTPSCTRSP